MHDLSNAEVVDTAPLPQVRFDWSQ